MFSSYLCKVKSIPNIRELTFEQLSEAVADFGEKSFRAKQIYDWLWNKSARSFDQMNNVPLSLRNKLAEKFAFTPIVVAHEQRSNDRTIKYGFKLHDDHLIEGVLIPTASRMTACVSSQVGCSLSCKFCATGKLDRVRNLNADEIYDQVAIIREQSMEVYNIPLSNIVYMGMGEPLLNYANVLASIERITSANGLGMSPQRITVSTAGIAKMITKLGDDEVKFNLALSLHAANDSKRDKIMPINEHNNLEVLRDALKYFYDKTGTRVTYEFIVFNNFNDTLKDAQELAEFAKHVPCKINLIEYNAIGDGVFEKARLDRLEVFKNYLESKNLVVNIRRSRGKDIDAACGQLANKNQ
ncbi:MAG TPA: 23S rRNA (adenine(2503)-C(2))-methyltransferase RlmN [Bacteroidia bacterium]|nr:23S rRNA (adenine(2503)-C(2))-methyltransferase RlmN [Bacteroidia bacterium]MBP7715279.1 23S rRNA (adenine(2503)-C(2))-methyltransferase RlmN [Bacteroidia bacterium]MBP8669262.1 23S rRNA (adenine(2503)-C(2))-methyltransferase RlmN [Bacteroidia bacterium]HOZ83762.1 23S rRNA (adenine(2503)-C(2))-methyltransferase RlmN [Bacteroidia bacterium]HOZ90664.1 23S rRNA (adenine(2503)-C(2))-methyltransferase RlmN [Bacteroidia bacterium]